MSKLIATVVLTMFAGSTAFAATAATKHYATAITHTQVSAPEIDPASSLSGLTMLAGGLAVLRGRRKK